MDKRLTKDKDTQYASKKVDIAAQRKLPFPLQIVFYIFTLLSVLIAVDFFFSLGLLGFYFTEYQYYYILIALLMPFVYLLLPASKTAQSYIPWYDYFAAATIFSIAFYFSTQYEPIQWGYWTMNPPLLSLILGTVLIVLTMESARRTGGTAFLIVCIVLSIVPLISHQLPGVLNAPRFEFKILVGHVAFDSEGFLGLPMKVIGGTLFGFLIFAGILIRTGAGAFFLDMANILGGRSRGGPAKVAVIGSAFFGSLSGSSMANIAGTGSVTIPAMKRYGYPNYYAGAVEACASTGGVLMPPVMGAVVFVMVTMTQIPYATILVAALIPSILFYLGLLIQIDGFAAKNGLKGVTREQLPRFWPVFKNGWHFIFVLIFLVWGLLVMRWEVLTPFYASALLFLIIVIMFKKTGFNLGALLSILEGIGGLLVYTIGIILPLAPVVAALLITGLAPSFTAGILNLSGGIPFITLLLGFIACYILGMTGLLVSAYLFLAMGLAPALEATGFNVLGVHLFIIYYAMLSIITPPVAAGAFLAANIANAKPMQTAVQAMRLGVVIYVIPFFFVYEPALILQEGTVWQISFHIATAVLGVLLIASSLEGYLIGIGKLKVFSRILIGIIGFLIAMPSTAGVLLSFVLAIPIVTLWVIDKRKIRDNSDTGTERSTSPVMTQATQKK
ncbi:MAG: TRAP transporter fused permease subunit [Syntrophales bacterium]|jgi:TRAP transporter 4TM/12TM fusion protein|nr:TRAP transporter fused permease subunit [Syntrophales bacterium]MDY0045109.1 TRAP transporter fused permease subunit [Syntrophales bacterium]